MIAAHRINLAEHRDWIADQEILERSDTLKVTRAEERMLKVRSSLVYRADALECGKLATAKAL